MFKSCSSSPIPGSWREPESRRHQAADIVSDAPHRSTGSAGDEHLSLRREPRPYTISAPQSKTPTSTRLVGVHLLGGVANGTRTHDNQNHNLGLYQLSYSHRRTELEYSAISHLFTRPTQIFAPLWLSQPPSCLRSGTRPCTRASAHGSRHRPPRVPSSH